MSTKIHARHVGLNDLVNQFGLEMIKTPNFFPEWKSNLPDITEDDKRTLDKIQNGYFNLVQNPPVIEETMKLAILSPLLFAANYFLQPLLVKTETPIRLIPDGDEEDEDEIVMEGKIDILVLKGNFWLMVIESKRPSYSLESGLAQMLTYMLASPNLGEGEPSYGMITNGGDFIFIKVAQTDDGPRYATSRSFALRNPGNDLYPVLQILKKLAEMVLPKPA